MDCEGEPKKGVNRIGMAGGEQRDAERGETETLESLEGDDPGQQAPCAQGGRSSR
jgi:hypothetical protein